MPENTIMMIHEPYGAAVGTAADMRSMAEALDRAGDAIVVAYRRSRQPAARIKALLAAETWMGAQEAVDLGFADRVADPVAIAASFDLSKFNYRHPPRSNVAAGWDKVIRGKFAAR
jgi:ATP-dependent protease ClpP protease subunit